MSPPLKLLTAGTDAARLFAVLTMTGDENCVPSDRQVAGSNNRDSASSVGGKICSGSW